MKRYLFQVIGNCFQDASEVKINKDVDFLVEENEWNDYGYITYYTIHSTPKISKRDRPVYLGAIRIMKVGQKVHEKYLLREEFKKDNLTFDSLPYN